MNRFQTVAWLRRFVLILPVMASATMGLLPFEAAAADDEPLEIGVTPQLFIDDALVDNRYAFKRNGENVLRRFHSPVKHGTQPVLVDRDAAPSYFGVAYDADAKVFRLWYQANVPVVIGEKTEKKGVMGFRHVRYAESADGIHWTLPELGLYEFRGNKKNNICYMRPGTFEQKVQGFGTSSVHLLDTSDVPEKDRRGYKYLMTYTLRGGGNKEADKTQVYLIGSRDGIHWDGEGQKSIVGGSISDGWLGMVYDPKRKQYVGYCRPRDRYDSGGPVSPSNADFQPDADPRVNELLYAGVVRRIGRIESDDLWKSQEAWPQIVILPDEIDLKNKSTAHMSMGTKYYGGAYFGFLHPYDPHESVWTELVLSRDGKSFERTHESMVAPGTGNAWDSKQTWGIPDWCEVGDEWWFYYFGGNSPPNLPFQTDTQWGIGLAKIRKEGFISLALPPSGGAVITKLLTWPGGDLLVNCDATAGEMRVRVSDKQRRAYPGLNYSDCVPFTGDKVRHNVRWNNASLRELKGKEVRLEFYFSKQADLYSFLAAPSLPAAQSAAENQRPKQVAELKNSIGMQLALIPRGTFTMGSLENEQGRDADELQHEVEITRDFYLGKYEVTMGQFRTFVQETNYRTEPERDNIGGSGYSEQSGVWILEGRKSQYNWKNTGLPQSDEHPVLNVTWNDAVAFCDWLSKKESRRYRLPTEAEWEYACRANTRTRYSSGDDEASLATVANLADPAAKQKFPHFRASTAHTDPFPYTAPVGKLQPNSYGLHDMHGNLWEWCADWYDENYYRNASRKDPSGPATGTLRVARGGCWNEASRTCRSADRSRGFPHYRSSGVGFRIAADLGDVN